MTNVSGQTCLFGVCVCLVEFYRASPPLIHPGTMHLNTHGHQIQKGRQGLSGLFPTRALPDVKLSCPLVAMVIVTLELELQNILPLSWWLLQSSQSPLPWEFPYL